MFRKAATALENRAEGMLRDWLTRPLGAGIPATPPAPGTPAQVIIRLAVGIAGIPGVARGILTVSRHVLHRCVLCRILRQSGQRECGGKNHCGAKKS